MSALVLTASRVEAERWEPSGREVCISIRSSSEAPATLSEKFVDVLPLAFDLTGPNELTEGAARTLAEFAARHRDADTILVHCQEGRVRSRAVARAIAFALELRCGAPSSRMYPEDRNLYERVRRAFASIEACSGDTARILAGVA